MAEARDVPQADWLAAVREARSGGFDVALSLVAVDEIGLAPEIRVLLLLESSADGRRLQLSTRVPRDDARLPGIAAEYPGAAWLQRQVRDFFAVEFEGDDNRPLLNHAGGAPLRKDVILEPRVDTRWPGSLEPGESDASPSRRRLVPPGVPEPGLLDDPAATAADIALSAAGARIRRGR